MSQFKVRNILQSTLKQHFGYAFAFMLSIILSNLILLAPGFIAFFALNTDAILLTPHRMVSVLGVVVLGVFTAIFYQHYAIAVLAARFSQTLRQTIFDKLMHQEVAFFDKNSDLSQRVVADIQKLQDLIEKVAPLMIRHMLLMALACLAIVWVSSLLFFVAILLLPGLLLQHIYMSKQARFNAYAYQNLLSKAATYVHEMFSHIRTIHGLRDHNQKTFARYLNQIEQTSQDNAMRSAFLSACCALLCMVILGGIVFLGADLIRTEHVTLGSLSAFLYFLFLIVTSLYIMGQATPMVNKLVMLYVQLMPYTKLTTPQSNDKPLPVKPASGLMAIHNVDFAYARFNNHIVLHDVNVSIYPNETIAIVGPPGAGKTTLLSLLMRFYKPIKGNIYLDGININDLSSESLYAEMTIVDQEPVLFSNTVYENMRMGNPKVTEQDVIDVLDLLFPYDWQEQFPKGLATLIGPQGYGLSMGQKQCLTLARALLRNPRVLLLDEATSGLDNATESQIHKNILPILKERTTIMVTHKLNSIVMADRVIVMKSSRVVAVGTHQELYAENLYYRSLIASESYQRRHKDMSLIKDS